MSNKKVSGVWMDSAHAYIIATNNRAVTGEYEIVAHVKSENHDDSRHKNEKSDMAREVGDLRKFFKEIASHIDEDNTIFVFGPGKAQEQFKHFLEDYQNFKSKTIELGTADKMTNNEMIAKVKIHFES
jgi:stalled ribosome rescue protein Dom34